MNSVGAWIGGVAAVVSALIAFAAFLRALIRTYIGNKLDAIGEHLKRQDADLDKLTDQSLEIVRKQAYMEGKIDGMKQPASTAHMEWNGQERRGGH